MKKHTIRDNFASGRYTLTGAAVGAIQIFALMPLPFILLCTGYQAFYAHVTPFSFLFRLGMALISRAELFAVSLIYRSTLSETALFFGVALSALAFGVAAKLVVSRSEKASNVFSYVLAVWLAADLVIRALPVHINGAFGAGYDVAAFIIRAALLCVVVFDILKRKKTKKAAI